MNAQEMRAEMLRMLSATAAMSLGAGLAIGTVIVALAAIFQ